MLARVVAVAMGLRFDRAASAGVDATLELRLRLFGGRRIVPLRLRVVDEECQIVPGAAPEASAQVAIGLGDMVRVVLGLVAWPSLLSSGRLELSGDPFLALRFPTLFRLAAVGSAAHATP